MAHVIQPHQQQYQALNQPLAPQSLRTSQEQDRSADCQEQRNSNPAVFEGFRPILSWKRHDVCPRDNRRDKNRKSNGGNKHDTEARSRELWWAEERGESEGGRQWPRQRHNNNKFGGVSHET